MLSKAPNELFWLYATAMGSDITVIFKVSLLRPLSQLYLSSLVENKINTKLEISLHIILVPVFQKFLELRKYWFSDCILTEIWTDAVESASC